MGRQVKRVPLDFDHPLDKIWSGYLPPWDPPHECEACEGSGYAPDGAIPSDNCFRDSRTGRVYCERCEGEGEVWYPAGWAETEPPPGPGYQLWENVTEGSPITPVFATPEELAHWLAGPDSCETGFFAAPYESWLKLIESVSGYTPSFGIAGGVLRPGVEMVNNAD